MTTATPAQNRTEAQHSRRGAAMFGNVQSTTEQSSDHSADAFALQVQGLTKRYGDLVAVHDLNLQIKKGEIFGFLGPNG
ncbi:MAG: hypothetical protein ACXVIX_11410, partial [Halobacteriota archaeon]